MLPNGCITPDEFDAVHRALTDKLSHYDSALTQLMVACRQDKKSKVYKEQALYWKHCMAAIKDTISYARTLIRNNNERATVQPPWPNYSDGGNDDVSGQDGEREFFG